MKINNLQLNRKELENSQLKKYLDKKFNKSKILVSNYWFIVIPDNKKELVKKYYINSEFFNKEINNYNYLEWNLVIPKIKIIWEVDINNNKLYLIELNNIRESSIKFNSTYDIWITELWKILWKLHSIDFKEWYSYLHWNLHHSNFFIDNKWQLGVFDFVWMIHWRVEYDFLNIYINSDFNDMFIEELLEKYKYKNYFKYNIFYKFCLEKIINDIKLDTIYSKNRIIYLKKVLLKIKNKLWNLI